MANISTFELNLISTYHSRRNTVKKQKLEELLKILTTIDFEDIASVPKKEQPNFVDHVESLQDQLIKVLNDQLRKEQKPPYNINDQNITSFILN